MFLLLRRSLLRRSFASSALKVTEGVFGEGGVSVLTVPILEDNYCYVLLDNASKEAVVVDGAEPARVASLVEALGAKLVAAVTTHHHADHAQGNETLRDTYGVRRFYASSDARVPCTTHAVADGDELKLTRALRLRAVDTACHTRTHMCYVARVDRDRFALTGDTLFLAGCGRFFEGDAADMRRALRRLVAALDDADDAVLFCGHEYGAANLRFAASLEPWNDALRERVAWLEARRAQALPAMPTTLAAERRTNLFLRAALGVGDNRLLAKALGFTERPSAVELLHALREKKNAS